MKPFGERLKHAISVKGPLCLGIDPHASLLRQWGLGNDVDGVEYFSMQLLEAIGDKVAAVKPQVAFFERFGSRGIAALEKVLQRAREEFNVLTIGDAKRGDIGSTMSAYAEAWLGDGSPLANDAVTLSPYLGYEALRPAIDMARQQSRGVFVLVLTSNPEGLEIQGAETPGAVGHSVASVVMQHIAADNRAEAAFSPRLGESFLGSVGCVIGATMGGRLAELGIDLSMGYSPVLVPGFGAQGGNVPQLRRYFAGKPARTLVNSGRDIARAGPDKKALRDKASADADQLSFLI